MKQGIEISFSSAVRLSKEITEEKKLHKSEKLKEFLESDISMLDSRDLEFYEGETGIPIENLLCMYSDMQIVKASKLRDLTSRLAEMLRKNKDVDLDIDFNSYLRYNPFKKRFLKYRRYFGWIEATEFNIQTIINQN